MTAPSRRKAIQILFSAAITPALVRPAPILAAPGRFAPETGVPMTFTRTLERALSDGAAIVVQRSFLVSFAEVGAGFAITGEQSDVEVTAPPALSSLAGIERSRIDTASFPMQLGANGWMMGAAAESDQIAMNDAVSEGIALISAAGLSQDEAAQARAFLASMQRAASDALSPPPADLFCPPEVKRTSDQMVSLPGGMEGNIQISFSGEKWSRTGLMRSAQRTITTTLEGSSRHSTEFWSLAPLS